MSSPLMESTPVSRWAIYWQTLRPKTLSISVVPVITGNALAWHDQQHINVLIFLATLFAALCIQIGTNLYNDAADFERGADNDQRLGPARATHQGWFSASQIKSAAAISFLLAFVLGIFLVWHGGWPIVVLGLLSIACGYAYTGGPWPIAYSPLGEIFVLLFFGLFAVGGSYYLQTLSIDPISLLLGSAIGAMAAAILLINNYRDLDSDRQANKLTLVHYIGRQNTQRVYQLFLLYPFVLVISLLILSANHNSPWLLLCLLSLPMASKLIKQLQTTPVSTALNKLLAKTAQYQLMFSLLFCMGLLI